MSLNRERLSGLSEKEQLLRLIREEEISIEDHPAELANSAGLEFLRYLSSYDRNHFEKLLSHTKLRILDEMLRLKDRYK